MTTAHQPTAVAVPEDGTYVVDPARSRVAFATRHLFGLAAVRGEFAVTSGTLVVAQEHGATAVEAVAATSSFDTGDARRDRLIAGRRFLDAQAHPDLAFRSTALTRDDHGWTLRGELTAAGRTAPLDLALTRVHQDGRSLDLEATGRVDRYAHGLTAARGLAARYLHVTVSARASR